MKKQVHSLVKPFLLLAALLVAIPALSWDAQKKIVLQAYWWDYWNNNYENSYANYLTELAPRLREMDINAIWVPPFYKNTGTNSVGYSPFDHYDLGDKYQKGSVTTRFGTKDDVLRMIAVMHANGIEVIADIVLNHVDGANVTDPIAPSNQWKTFRYVCYSTPESTGSDSEYLAREGRWPKNWPNFHPNDSHNNEDENWTQGYWGPDICYYEGAYGQSSNATYNPEQYSNYMRTNAREWIMWFKKQTAVDGFRWDAVKHFPEWVQQDLSWNVKYALPDWCQGGEAMFNVGEYIGTTSETDNYVSTVTGYGDEFLMGSFDYTLREEIKDIMDGAGFSYIGDVVNYQVNQRYADYSDQRVHRTVNYINSHDTFRPTTDASGNYTGWDTSNETGEHIDPFDDRLPMAYAIAAAMDGNLVVYMEDLFNLSNSNRWTHDPKSETELPARDALVNIIWCHQNLDFKYGEYKVPYQSDDLLVIERSGRALIAISDNGSSDQSGWVSANFGSNVELKDYSGSFSDHLWTNGDGWVEIRAPKASNGGLGYAIWAPVKGDSEFTYAPYRDAVTVQEWEMSDDLGDSNCSSLGQGGALPEKSTNQRLVGKIYPEQGTDVTVTLYPSEEGYEVMLALYDLDGNLLASDSGTGEFAITWNATYTGWVAMKVWNVSANNPSQTVYVNASYQAPKEITDTMNDRADTRASIWTGNAKSSDWTDCLNWEQGVVPTRTSRVVIPDNGDYRPKIVKDITIAELYFEKGEGSMSSPDITINSTGSLTVTGSATAGSGTAYVVGAGASSAGSLQNVVMIQDETILPVEETEDENNSIELYPSPARNYLNIATPVAANQTIEIFDLSACKVLEDVLDESLKTLDISGLSQGTYIVRVGNNSYKFIKL